MENNPTGQNCTSLGKINNLGPYPIAFNKDNGGLREKAMEVNVNIKLLNHWWNDRIIKYKLSFLYQSFTYMSVL